jgi:mediator of RNA polymerase II transcription subunit 16, fungi type
MEQADDFNTDPFFNDGSLQQIDASVGIDALNAVTLPSSPLVVERILNLQACGCLNRVAWSRAGHIASVSEDGAGVDFCCLVFDRESSSWTLSPKRTESSGLGDIASLAWSPVASDLAVLDSRGRLSILRPQPTASNRVLEVRSGLSDELDELSQVVGLHWLGQDRLDQPVSVLALLEVVRF